MGVEGGWSGKDGLPKWRGGDGVGDGDGRGDGLKGLNGEVDGAR